MVGFTEWVFLLSLTSLKFSELNEFFKKKAFSHNFSQYWHRFNYITITFSCWYRKAQVFEHSFAIATFIMIMFVASYSAIFSPPVTDELMYGRIQQNNLCIDIEIGHVPAIAKLGKCSADKDTQVMFCFFPHRRGRVRGTYCFLYGSLASASAWQFLLWTGGQILTISAWI